MQEPFAHDAGVAESLRRRSCLWRAVRIVLVVLCAAALLAVLWVGVLVARLPSVRGIAHEGAPPPSAYMRQSACGDTILFTYRPLAELSPRLVCAVVVAEDRRFFRHQGIDWQAVRDAARQALRERRVVSGAGTIAMQVARNWFLSGTRSLRRKIQEGILAGRLLRALGRYRVLEIYLNLAEWGPCRYGAEAGAYALFARGTETLDWFEATLLAVLLPRPKRPLSPTDGEALARRQHTILRYLATRGLLSPGELALATTEVDRTWEELAKTRSAEAVLQALRLRTGQKADSREGRWIAENCHL